jgi:hypothetical protein
MANYKSQRDGQFVESMAVGLPAKMAERSMRFDSPRQGASVAARMDTLAIVIMLEGIQFPL